MNNISLISFDCYGTLIDWESGILNSLSNILRSHQLELQDEKILSLYAELESACETGPFKPYRQVLNQVVVELGKRLAFEPSAEEIQSLANGVGRWKPFPDTIQALKKLKSRFRLAVISNVDDDLFMETARHLEVEFDFVVTALQVQSYKPSIQNFEFAFTKFGILKSQWMHAAQSLYHDIEPANAFGVKTIWVNRREGKQGQGAVPDSNAKPDLIFPDLKSLADGLI